MKNCTISTPSPPNPGWREIALSRSLAEILEKPRGNSFPLPLWPSQDNKPFFFSFLREEMESAGGSALLFPAPDPFLYGIAGALID